jgi:hypothetical protein
MILTIDVDCSIIQHLPTYRLVFLVVTKTFFATTLFFASQNELNTYFVPIDGTCQTEYNLIYLNYNKETGSINTFIVAYQGYLNRSWQWVY